MNPHDLANPRRSPAGPNSNPRSPGAPRIMRPERARLQDCVRPTRAEIDLSKLRHNLGVLRRASRSPVWGVLKADAYGHGAKPLARTLVRAGIAGICVALLEEAIELRDAGIRTPILVMGGFYGGAWSKLLEHQLTPVLFDPAQIEALAEEVRFTGASPMSVHIKIDTGMARLGATSSQAHDLGATLLRHPEVKLEGLMTHFACADTSVESIGQQLNEFDVVTAKLTALGLEAPIRHAANSAAVFRSERSHLNMTRPGIALFGVEPAAGMAAQLKPVMKVRSEFSALREIREGNSVGYGASWTAKRTSRIGTLPIGYADGLPRSLSNRGHVLVRGKRAPIVGTVSMDMTMIDVTEIENVGMADEVVVLGEQTGPLGSDEITAREIADHSGTIAWEILTNISRRVPRFLREP